MKKTFATLFSILFISLVLVLVFVFVPTVSAGFNTNYSRHDELAVLAEDEVIERDFFATGETVRLRGTVIGDAYLVGGQIFIDGLVEGDLLVAGGTVTINGEVTQDVRAVGGNIYINGKVGRNLTVVAGNVEISDAAELNGSLVGGAGNINIYAPVAGNIMVGVGALTINSVVAGDIDAGVGQLTLTDTAFIGGNLNYISDENARIDDSAVVIGEVNKMLPKPDDKDKSASVQRFTRWGGFSLLRFLGILSTIVVGLLLIHFLPNHVQKTVNTLKISPGKSLVYGILGLFLIPIALFVLTITIIGFPLALILLALYLIYLSLAKFYIMAWAGEWTTKRFGRKMGTKGTFLVGLLVFYIVTSIPVVWVLVRIPTYFFGFGALLITCRAFYTEARKKNLI